MPGRMLYIHALSPIQNGTGRGSGVIDLPIARESTTGWPAIYGSTIKGVLRDACAEKMIPDKPDDQDAEAVADWKSAIARHRAVFGPDVSEDPSSQAGGVIFTDARLLCFPARSLAGSFAWLTCPMALRRWMRDQSLAGLTPPAFSHEPAEEPATILLGASGTLTKAATNGRTVFLEDLDLAADTSHAADVDGLARFIAGVCFPGDTVWQGMFTARFGVVPDSIFTFLAKTATDVAARIRIEDTTKTVADTGLWYEEAIPAEAILAAPVLPTPLGARNAAVKGEDDLMGIVAAGLAQPRQIGGNATVGRGLVWLRLANGAGGDA